MPMLEALRTPIKHIKKYINCIIDTEIVIQFKSTQISKAAEKKYNQDLFRI